MFQAQHVGVYGIVLHQESILMIQKSRGPYTGLLDLPGGSFEHGESAEEALHREFLEEVGGHIATVEFFCIETFTSTWDYNGRETSTHHIGIYYLATLADPSRIKMDADGHDSLGAVWVNRTTLQATTVAPIVARVLQRLHEAKGTLEESHIRLKSSQ